MSSSESTSAKETPPLGVQIAVSGVGAVSPAGWGIDSLREALREQNRPAIQQLERPGWTDSFEVRLLPAVDKRPLFLSHARLRRTSPITQYAIAAAVEALGEQNADSN